MHTYTHAHTLALAVADVSSFTESNLIDEWVSVYL